MNNDLKNIAIKGFDLLKNKLIKKEVEMSEVKIPYKPGITYGVEETEEVIDFAILLANSLIKTFEDGKISIFDLTNFITPMVKLPKAISGIDKVPSELYDLDSNEYFRLKDKIKTQLNVDDAAAMNIIDNSIDLIYSIYNLIKAIKK